MPPSPAEPVMTWRVHLVVAAVPVTPPPPVGAQIAPPPPNQRPRPRPAPASDWPARPQKRASPCGGSHQDPFRHPSTPPSAPSAPFIRPFPHSPSLTSFRPTTDHRPHPVSSSVTSHLNGQIVTPCVRRAFTSTHTILPLSIHHDTPDSRVTIHPVRFVTVSSIDRTIDSSFHPHTTHGSTLPGR